MNKENKINESHKKHHKKRKVKRVKVFGKKIIFDRLMLIITNAFFILLLLGAGAYYQFYLTKDYLSKDDAKKKAEDFINGNLLSPGMTADITEISSDKGLYKLKVNLGGGQEVDSYMTKEGDIFFTNALNIKEIEKEVEDSESNTQTEEKAEVENKNDKPVVELFVMSHCPYGTQIEKGIIPVVETLGDKIDFQLKFVYYAMHDTKELYEQLNQYCIQKNEPAKLVDYLTCFLEEDSSEQSSKCMDKVGIDKDKISSCAQEADSEYKVTENYNNKDTWNGSYPTFDIYKAENDKYGVSGSPTLVINEEKISSGRDSASLLSAICSAFSDEPSECEAELSSDTPSAGFGAGTASGSTDASCN